MTNLLDGLQKFWEILGEKMKKCWKIGSFFRKLDEKSKSPPPQILDLMGGGDSRFSGGRGFVHLSIPPPTRRGKPCIMCISPDKHTWEKEV